MPCRGWPASRQPRSVVGPELRLADGQGALQQLACARGVAEVAPRAAQAREGGGHHPVAGPELPSWMARARSCRRLWRSGSPSAPCATPRLVSVAATSRWCGPKVASSMASARSSSRRCRAASPSSPKAMLPWFVRVAATTRCRSPNSRSWISSALASRSRWRPASPRAPQTFPRLDSVIDTFLWPAPYSRSLMASARSSRSRPLR
ncbi:unnamed protein product [Prorocentrum cordatum]|uniref:Uncharacterized protein n=1 Tax=Prorocentrum cordatum TaxID=2364126 RepID=A0ABN9T7U3_9DINO|nr:unnamed protein product [Polarella glacialis]